MKTLSGINKTATQQSALWVALKGRKGSGASWRSRAEECLVFYDRSSHFTGCFQETARKSRNTSNLIEATQFSASWRSFLFFLSCQHAPDSTLLLVNANVGSEGENVQRWWREVKVPLGYNIESKNHSVVIKKGIVVSTWTSFWETGFTDHDDRKYFRHRKAASNIIQRNSVLKIQEVKSNVWRSEGREGAGGSDL